MKRFASFFIFCLCTTGLLYAEPLEISLWNGNPPSDNGLRGEETYNGTYYANVTQAALFVFQPETPNGLAILACPGGSYNTLWTNHELTDLAEWFTSRGVVFAMLKYRLPNGHPTIPLEDVQQAMKLMRHGVHHVHRRHESP